MIAEITLRSEDCQLQLREKVAPKNFPKSMKLVNIHLENNANDLDVEAILAEGKKIGQFRKLNRSVYISLLAKRSRSRTFFDHLAIFVSPGYPKNGLFYVSRDEFSKLVLWFLPK